MRLSMRPLISPDLRPAESFDYFGAMLPRLLSAADDADAIYGHGADDSCRARLRLLEDGFVLYAPLCRASPAPSRCMLSRGSPIGALTRIEQRRRSARRCATSISLPMRA